MIEIRDLYKSFGGLSVLSGVSLEIPTGSIFGLAGRSGAGKSTLLRCINGLETFDAGSLKVDGVDVHTLSEREGRMFRKDIGMIFQQFSLLGRMTVFENVALPMKCWGCSRKAIEERVRELLKLVEIPEKIQARPAELSGGQKQRVAIARALALEPKILLCDEATSALDPRVGKSILALLEQINRQLGITIVMVTHQMSVIRRCCSQVAVLEQGRVADFGTAREVFFRRAPALRRLMGEEEYPLPETGRNLRIRLDRQLARSTFVTRVARELDMDFTVLEGEAQQYRGEGLMQLTLNVAEADWEKTARYLGQQKVPFLLLERKEGGADV